MYGPLGQRKPGLIDMAGQLRNLGGVVGNIGYGQLADAALCAGPLPAAESLPRLGSPLTSMRKLIAIGAFAQFPLRNSFRNCWLRLQQNPTARFRARKTGRDRECHVGNTVFIGGRCRLLIIDNA